MRPALALALALAAAPAAAQTPDAWPEHAAPDGDVAREGRAALPFTQRQIELLGRLLRQTQRATAAAAGAPPAGRVRRVRLEEGAVPEIAVARGYATAIFFADLTGAPWPIAEALVDARFLPGEDERPPGSEHLLFLAPQRPFLSGNAAVKLRGRPDPVMLTLRGDGGAADFRVEIRLGAPGPNADSAALAQPAALRAGDPALLGLLGGAIPPGAARLEVAGSGLADRAWRLDGDLLLVTRLHVLSPGPLAAERGSGGRWAYRLPDTPHALVSNAGAVGRLSFRGEGADAD